MSELVGKRLAICKTCPLYKVGNFGAVCNPKLYINKEGEVSYTPKPDYKRGCNCILHRKAAHPENHCIIEKW